MARDIADIRRDYEGGRLDEDGHGIAPVPEVAPTEDGAPAAPAAANCVLG